MTALSRPAIAPLHAAANYSGLRRVVGVGFVLRLLLGVACMTLIPGPVHANGTAVTEATAAYQTILKSLPDSRTAVVVDVSDQKLYLFQEGKLKASYPVSTSEYGIGNKANSNKTPLGLHRVKKKIGDGEPINTIFKARASIGRTATIITEPRHGDSDDVTTRILWLEGLEEGVNKGPGIDSYRRYIYIHGTPEEGLIGRPASHGCIRMRNAQVIHLFDRVPENTPVLIVE